MKYLFIVAIGTALVLAGCSSAPKIVKIPVPVVVECPVRAEVAPPSLTEIPASATPDEIVKVVIANMLEYKAHAKQLESTYGCAP